MGRVELLLAQMDEVYGRLAARLEGLTDAEYFDDRPWRPPRRGIGCLRDLYRVMAGGA